MKKEEEGSGLARLKQSQGLPLPDPESDAAVSGIALLLSGKLDNLSASHIRKIRNRYLRLRKEVETGKA